MTITTKTRCGFEVIEIVEEHSNSKAVICPERGGILIELVLGGEQLLYLNEETFADKSKNIRGGNPILFPISGALTNNEYIIDGETYILEQHGFARNMAWEVEATDSNSVTLSLQDTEETFSVYPFEFLLTFTYILEDGTLQIHQQYENHAERTMPFYAGFHPYFLGNHRQLSYEIASQQYLDYADFNTKKLETDINQLEINPAKVFLNLSEQKVAFGSGEKKVVLSFSREFPVVVLWSETPDQYVCVEPWMAGPDAFTNEDKVIELEAGKVMIATFTIAYE